MLKLTDKIKLYKSILSTDIWKVKPSLIIFLWQYLRKFEIRKVSDKYIIHSHLPPLNSKPYRRFISEFLVNKQDSLSHAQIGVTNVCPMNCDFCYNKDRKGTSLDTKKIIKTIDELKELGIIWIGLTGGEPLLNDDIVKIVDSIGDKICSKLFTSGYGLTEKLADDLKKAGLDYVSVSLDHGKEEEFDYIRGYKGAYQTALKAIEIFKKKDFHVSVSTVLTRSMIDTKKIKSFMDFLISLGVDEAWLSEVKPSCKSFWDSENIITEKEKNMLIDFQDLFNKKGDITVNYLGHFEGKENFGCSAGNRMLYVDSFGEVSPCVFTPCTFGNVQKSNLKDIYREMKTYFPTEDSCFINKNYKLFDKYSQGALPLSRERTIELMDEVEFGPLSRFFRIFIGEDQE